MQKKKIVKKFKKQLIKSLNKTFKKLVNKAGVIPDSNKNIQLKSNPATIINKTKEKNNKTT